MFRSIILLSLFSGLISCGRQMQYPGKITERVSSGMTAYTDTSGNEISFSGVYGGQDRDEGKSAFNPGSETNFAGDSLSTAHHNIPDQQVSEAANDTAPDAFFLPEGLVQSVRQYNQRDAEFNLARTVSVWDATLPEVIGDLPGDKGIAEWVGVTGMLLELTGEARYAEEMERLYYDVYKNGDSEKMVKERILPFIFTKSADHIHVNIYTPSEISYEHTLHGRVKIAQVMTGPGRMEIRFSMENRRYIELYVRIPSWASGASVTVKKVKYLAVPGEYCLIAKKWKEGDVVEVVYHS